MKDRLLATLAVCLLASLCALLIVDPAAAQFVPAPNAPAIPRGPMALLIDPHTQVEIQLSILDSTPGVYEKLTASPGHVPAPDQVYADLRKAGATVALSPTIFTTSGIRASISETAPIPYQAEVDGQTKTLSINVGTTVDTTPEVTTDGIVALSIGYTRIDAANNPTSGAPPQTNTVSFSAWREVRPGESMLLGVIKPIPNYGTQMDEVAFVRVLSVKRM